MIPKKKCAKNVHFFDKNFDIAALTTHGEIRYRKCWAAGLKVDVQAIYGHRRKGSEDGKIRKTEKSGIRILVYIHTYIHTYIDRPN